jgi:RNA polymerase sigma-70 factor, ECF subfamily
METTDYIARCKQGDKKAFVSLFRGHKDQAYRYCLGMVGSHQDAVDIVQDAFLAAYQGIGRIDSDRGFTGWFFGILRHLCLATLRGRKHQGTDEIFRYIPSDDPGPEKEVQKKERAAALRECLDQLTLLQREVIVMREFEGLEYQIIAQRLEVPMGTVMSRLYDARKALSRLLRNHPSFQEEVAR